jgi:hypothetical protein
MVVRPEPLLSFKQLLIFPHETEWTQFQTHCYSEDVVALGVEPETLV